MHSKCVFKRNSKARILFHFSDNSFVSPSPPGSCSYARNIRDKRATSSQTRQEKHGNYLPWNSTQFQNQCNKRKSFSSYIGARMVISISLGFLSNITVNSILPWLRNIYSSRLSGGVGCRVWDFYDFLPVIQPVIHLLSY